MSPELKKFLEDCAENIKEDNFVEIYKRLYQRYDSIRAGLLSQELFDVFKKAGINPLDNSNYVPENYAVGNLSIEKIDLPPNIDTIENYAFYNCEKLKEINLEHVTYISKLAFYACFNLKKLKFADDVTIGQEAFLDCIGLEEIYLPKTFTVGYHAFAECPIKTVYYDGTPQEWYDKHQYLGPEIIKADMIFLR